MNLPADELLEPRTESRSSSYEPPTLTPIGSLHDLLAGGGTQACDSGTFQAGPTPQQTPFPPFC